MRPRLLAALLLLPLPAAACDRDPVGGDASLVGEWQSSGDPLPDRAPNGSANVMTVLGWSFHADGSYVETTYVVDVTSGQRWVWFRQLGTWGTSGETLSLTVMARFTTPSLQDATDSPQPSPITPYVEHDRYQLDGADLTIFWACPPGASCGVAPVLHRVQIATAE